MANGAGFFTRSNRNPTFFQNITSRGDLEALPPEDILTEQDLNRRQQIADMLLQQGLEPRQPFTQAGRFVVPMHWAQGLAQLGQAAAGAYGTAQIGKEKGRLVEDWKQRVAQALGQIRSSFGTPPTPSVPVMPVGGGESFQPAQRPATPTSEQRQQAIATAIISGDPRLQAWAQHQAQVYEKREERQAQEQAKLQEIGAKAAETPPHAVDIGDELILYKGQKEIGRFKKGQSPKERQEAAQGLVTVGPSGEIAKNLPVVEAKKEIAAAGASKQTTNIQNFAPASVEAQRDFMKSSRATYDQLKQAPATLQNIERTKALIPGAKNFMGPGGETLLQAAKFLNDRLGTQIDTKGVKNAEELRTRMFFQTMDLLKKVDAQPSQLQQLIMQQSFGNLGTDPQAMYKMLDAYAEVLRDKISLYNMEVQGASKRGVKFPYDPTIKLPERKAAGGAPAQPGAVLRFDAQGNQVP
jgi:hypothetical protein